MAVVEPTTSSRPTLTTLSPHPPSSPIATTEPSTVVVVILPSLSRYARSACFLDEPLRLVLSLMCGDAAPCGLARRLQLDACRNAREQRGSPFVMVC